MGIKSVYVCDNCGKEQIFETKPINISKKGANLENPFIHVHNPDYSGQGVFVGEQHFCSAVCMNDFINKKSKEKES